MKIRNILYVITLMAYTLSLAHSVIPHHHHQTAEEAAAHNHAADHHHTSNHHQNSNHDHHHGNDKNDSEKNPSGTGHFFFFSHDANADVLISHGAIDNPLKSKKSQVSAHLKKEMFSFEVSDHLVFHPPQDDPTFVLKVVSSCSLRAPPSLLSKRLPGV